MKSILSLVLILSTLGASAVDLEQASNRQLLQEVAKRLEPGAATSSVIVTYLCDSSGYLKMETLGPAGVSKSESKYLSSTQSCEEQAVLLRQNKARVNGLTLLAVCDSSGYLYKYSIDEKAEIKSLSSAYLSSYGACLPQAKAINSQP